MNALHERLEAAVMRLELKDHVMLLILQAEKLAEREDKARARSLPAGDESRATAR